MLRLTDLQPTHASFMYLERYVNAGSPSGFSFQNTPGPGFCASDPTQHFDLPIFDCAPFGAVHVGDTPTLAIGELPVHPEMADNIAAVLGRAPSRHLPATPTSSGRTLAVVANGDHFYAKVAYQRPLGRVTRRMTRAHVLSAIEVSRIYEIAIDAGRLSPSFYIYREHSGLYFADETSLGDWGYVERDIAPYPRGTFIEVPAFALIATPPGGSRPLLEDVEITKRLVETGRLMGIPVHDHLIITGDTYTSLAERGLM